MKLTTKYKIKEAVPLLEFSRPILTIGSCFSELIGQKLKNAQHTVYQNPLGTLYHPNIIFRQLKNALQDDPLDMLKDHYCEFQNHYFNYYCHSSIRGHSLEAFNQQYKEALNKIAYVIKNNGLIIITLGTAWGYMLTGSTKIIGNCHKQDNKQFNRALTPINNIVNTFFDTKAALNNLNYHPTFLFTLSPIRHLKDGFEGNSLSKAYCRASIGEIINKDQDIRYFPAYEIMLDELRDYRFYADDLLHPSPLASTIIWDYFLKQFCSKKNTDIIHNWQDIHNAINHRPFIKSKEYVKFLENTRKKVNNFSHFFNTEHITSQIDKMLTECDSNLE